MIRLFAKPRKAPDTGAFFIAHTIYRWLPASLCLTLFATLAACATDINSVVVKKVVDGDTVRLESGETVRLLGINAPEKEFDQRPAQPLSLEATLLLRELVEGKTVQLTRGRVAKDQYKRTLGYLDLTDGTDVQHSLIERGYAFVVAFPPDIDRLDRYIAAEQEARANANGIWQRNRYTPLDAGNDKPIPGGFNLVSGRITELGRSKKNVRLSLGKSLVIGIRHVDWKQFWNGKAERLLGKTVIVRGWVSPGKKGRPAYLRVRHPAMIEIK